MSAIHRHIRVWWLFTLPLLLVAASQPALPQQRQAPAPAEIDRQADALLAKLTLEQKISLLGGEDNMFTHALAEIGLPRLKMSDGPMGVRTWGPTTGYAAGIGLAASWDPALAHRVGVALGQDAKARGVNFLLGPGVNIYRAPLNGRNFEYFGEDPYLASRIAVGYIEGVQSQDVVATVKHYDANNSEYDRHQINVVVDERTLREIYLPVFEAAVKEARVGAVMDSYNLVNGEHATQNHFLNVQVLRKDWGFRGIVMSDWGATYDAVAAANNGLDLEMPSALFMNAQTLLPALQEGRISTVTIDDKVRRILRTAIEFGFLHNDQTDPGIPLYDQSSREIALQSAEESAVLLKNEGHLLPLDTHRVHTIAIIGPDAYPAVPSAGGSAEVTAFAPVSFMTGLSDALSPHTQVLWNRGVKDLPDIFRSGFVASPQGGAGAGLFTDEAGQHPGLIQEEFAGETVSGEPAGTHTVPNINSWGGDQWASPSREKHAYRWTGYFIPQTSGAQRFIAASVGGDSYKLYVNGKLELAQGRREGQVPQSKDINLPAGKPAAVRFEYFPQTARLRVGLGIVMPEDMLDPDAAKIAARADIAVVSVGFDPRTEGEGHDRTYSLPAGQNELIQAVEAANPHTIVVLTAGGSVDTSPWLDRTPVFLQTWYAGQEAGRALARLLTGDDDPSGKLPISWERRLEDDPSYSYYDETPASHDVAYKEGIFVGYRGFEQHHVEPLFPFGFGLSYTTFAFSNLIVTPAESGTNGPVTVTFEVRNNGSRAGAEVAQVYVGDPSATVPRPPKELKGFERVMLRPGETRRISVTLNERSFAYWDESSKGWKVDPGKFLVYVGDSSDNVPLQGAFVVK